VAYNRINTAVYVGWQCMVFCWIGNLSRKHVGLIIFYRLKKLIHLPHTTDKKPICFIAIAFLDTGFCFLVSIIYPRRVVWGIL